MLLFMILAAINMPAAIALFALRVAAYIMARRREPKRYRPTRDQREAFEIRMAAHRRALRHNPELAMRA